MKQPEEPAKQSKVVVEHISTWQQKKYFEIADLRNEIKKMLENLTPKKILNASKLAFGHHSKQIKSKAACGARGVIYLGGLAGAWFTFGATAFVSFGVSEWVGSKNMRNWNYLKGINTDTDNNLYSIETLESLLSNEDFKEDAVSHKAFLMYYLLQDQLPDEYKNSPDKWRKSQRVTAIEVGKQCVSEKLLELKENSNNTNSSDRNTTGHGTEMSQFTSGAPAG